MMRKHLVRLMQYAFVTVVVCQPKLYSYLFGFAWYYLYGGKH